jgi:hypothetical protein
MDAAEFFIVIKLVLYIGFHDLSKITKPCSITKLFGRYKTLKLVGHKSFRKTSVLPKLMGRFLRNVHMRCIQGAT